MKNKLLCVLFVCCIFQVNESFCNSVTVQRQKDARYTGDPIAVRSMNPVFDTFPDSSLVDFSFLLDSPSGKHGFVEARKDGHFYFSESDERIRFWGVTIASDSIDVEKERIKKVVDVLARSGCNLLRLHETDNRGAEKYNLVRRCIIDEAYPNNNISSEFDPEYRDRVDYWIKCCQDKGIYVYLVLRGYRTFRSGDGVAEADKLTRSAKPYAFFDPRLIELQKEFASEWLFNHVNPYTGKPNGLNPAIALIEIENEDSIFFGLGSSTWNEGYIEPYRTDFYKMWNNWLREKYGSTEKLREAWTNDKGECPLSVDEKIEDGSIKFPGMAMKSIKDIDSIPWIDPDNSPPRNRDGARFAAEMQRLYFGEMRDHLRAEGCMAPLTAVVNSNIVIDTWTVVSELDFSAENAYLGHPSFKSGEAWVGKSFYSNENYLKRTDFYGLMPHMARYKWDKKPLVCREWTTCWPNEYRFSSLFDIASLSLMNDYDGLFHFDYKTWGNPDMLKPFGLQADPLRWGLFGYAAMMFINGEIKPDIQTSVAISYNNEDLYSWGSYFSQLHKLAYTNRLENFNPDSISENDVDASLIVTSGRSGLGKYSRNNMVLYDARYKARSKMSDEKKREGMLATSGYDFPWIYNEEGFPVNEVEKSGFRPVILNEEKSICKGFLDPNRNVVVLSDVSENDAYKVTKQFSVWLTKSGNNFDVSLDEENHLLSSLNDKIVRDTKEGRLTISSEKMSVISGEWEVGQEYAAGDLSFQSVSPKGTIVTLSLDDKPLKESRKIAIKMVTVAKNRGQLLTKVEGEDIPQPFVLADNGNPPIQTDGKLSDVPTKVAINGKTMVEVYLINGTWEVVIDYNKKECLVFCDTPNIKFSINSEVFGGDENIKITKYFYEYPPVDSGQSGSSFIYPGFAKYILIKD